MAQSLKPEAVWDKFWQEIENLPPWDSLSQLIYEILIKEIGPVNRQTILEAGSGTGRISHRLALDGAKLTLLDTSAKALEISRVLFEKTKLEAEFASGSIFEIPLPDNSFQIVWNAGVLEHFLEDKQTLALSEMARVCQKGGLIITINPYFGSLPYRFGKWYAEKTGAWNFGYEQPIKSLALIKVNGLILIKEYSAGFWEQFHFLVYLKHLHCVANLAELGKKKFRTFNHWPGYLLVSVFRKGNL